MAKFPEPPDLVTLAAIPPEMTTLPAGQHVTRIFFAGGQYPTQWDEFRHFGPTSSRFDHHVRDDLGRAHEQHRGIMYLAIGAQAFHTCVVEVFQGKERIIDTFSRLPTLCTFRLESDINLLDLTGNFATRMGASMAIHSGQHARARRWAQRLYDAYPNCDGLLYCSSMNGNQPAIALFERGNRALPARPLVHIALQDTKLQRALVKTARAFGYRVV